MVRRRVEIKKIEDTSKRQVTFTKRRQGLFKKAGELCKKCDAEIAVIAVSAAGNFYAFGNPTFESVIERYKGIKARESDDSKEINNERPAEEEVEEAGEEDIGLELSLGPHTGVKKQGTHKKESEKGLVLKNDEEKDKKMNGQSISDIALWDLPVDELKWDELQQLIARMEDMKKKVVDRANEIQLQGK